ncbi:hypothetical protein GALMADRAFT_774246 [Galerina marginata CBS 339.88]|uniref:Uncharacterized protein n=1 Tax=Galerina marginata (strain CBS 339.88) TaxID=685588 RepID=A0A067SPU5_GALM3|nr:hypothetical protein GALMADRAFT_774246 [Galerina marginata CBS 339.88]
MFVHGLVVLRSLCYKGSRLHRLGRMNILALVSVVAVQPGLADYLVGHRLDRRRITGNMYRCSDEEQWRQRGL